MTLDFSKMAQEAIKFSGSEEGSQKSKYPVLYPSEGKLKFRLLFNPASGQVGRCISVHKINDKKIPCAGTYGSKDDCEICRTLKKLEEAGIQAPKSYYSKTRGLFFAQFISADYELLNKKIKKDDIVLLLVPYIIYKQINKWIADYAQDAAAMAKIFSNNAAGIQCIEKGKEPTAWFFRADQLTEYKTRPTQEQFEELIENLPSLYETYDFHEKITPEEIALIGTTANELNRTLLGVSSDTAEMTNEKIDIPFAPPYTASASQPTIPDVASTKPIISEPVSKTDTIGFNHQPCFGSFTNATMDTDPQAFFKCKYCPENVLCKAQSNK